MPLTLGGVFARQSERTHIRHNQRIHLRVLQLFQIGGEGCDFLIAGHSVHSDVYLNAVAVGKFHCLWQFVGGEIPRE